MLWHIQLHFRQQILSDATSEWALYCYILPCTFTWSRSFYSCTCSHPTVSDPQLHILIFSKQHNCENLTSCNVTFLKDFDFHSSVDENLYLLRCYTMLIVEQSYSSVMPSKHWWLVKWLTPHSIPEDINLTSCSVGPNITFSILNALNLIILTKIISFPSFWSRTYSSRNVRISPCLLSTSLMKDFNLGLGSLISCTHDSVILYLKMSCIHSITYLHT